MDFEKAEILKKNLELAEEKLNTAPIHKVDEYLGNFLDAKESYVAFLKNNV